MKIKLLHVSLKMILAGTIALLIGNFLDLKYYTTASAIAILSIQWTKRDFINIGIKRLISGIIAVFLAAIMFNYLGQNFLIFTIFLLIFIIGSWYLNVPEGIVPSIVIVTHFLTNKITWPFILEEIGVLLVAVLVAFVINMLYPQYSLSEMKRSLLEVDSIIENEIISIKNKLELKENNYKIDSKKELKKIMSDAKMIDKDIIVQNDHRYIMYLYMRNTQLNVLINISKNVDRIKGEHEFKKLIADFAAKISSNIGFNNNATHLIKELFELNEFFIKEDLPKIRKEFEVRAILFQILNEFETFLNLKIEFHSKYPNFIEGEN